VTIVPGELRLPTNTRALDARALEIATTPFATHAARSELAVICHLRVHGHISNDEALQLVAADVHLDAALAHDSSQEFIQEPVFGVFPGVWSNLERLVQGETVTYEPEPDLDDTDSSTYRAWDAWDERRKEAAEEWLKALMADLEQALRSELIYDFKAAHQLPASLLQEVYSEAEREFFDSFYGIGASLECRPSSSAAGLGMPTKDTGVWVADWLARNVLHSIAELEKSDLDEAERTAQGRHLNLAWGLLKGFIYSGSHGHHGQSLPGMLANKTKVVTRVCDALTNGLAVLSEHEVPKEDWRGPNSELGIRIANTTTADLVAQLLKRIDEEKQFSEGLARL
jgi:hypothetical protein